ncbi:hypothetical protein ASPWEDRAFT_101081 [Aspergillus wentii DTO 134E9]|uniref:RNA 3'-terminal phosphate cyclase domain-containing protein n=1 Tax=Aspergillus wentii DTO 134E9 TaxID=1073089 RepID=A0A1L9S303_ASPWE|nr:uncharacterized protein ASPWEDRAFT_101081 [Aspergillus wentii DTO 134E9]KAI9929868.1 hypothetical protein MW887_011675 [Aspergillus wentii]OJJ41519.1 hypothetical protein ASPWEDRAFT_101081 [Aspergillus wentii DTO 134E9]
MAIHLNGQTLEGGGQLVRIALALSSITKTSISITQIRNKRHGKKGLKASHLAAVHFLSDLTGSTVSGAQVGSSELVFTPPSSESRSVSPSPLQAEYNIRLDTAGAVFLIFQAVYPYLLHAGREKIRLNLTGGTNVAFAPSYDYIAQVLSPNLVRLGLPGLEMEVKRRGWSRGRTELGMVTMVVNPLASDGDEAVFPTIDMGRFERGEITQIDVTILAPDDALDITSASKHSSSQKNKKRKPREEPAKKTSTARQYLASETASTLREKLASIPSSSFPEDKKVPITLHTSERTYSQAHMYVMVVGHTSTGFRIGQDALLGSFPMDKTGRNKSTELESNIQQLAKCAVDRFIKEIYDPNMDDASTKTRPCVDEHMRDQLVIFEALGRLSNKDDQDQNQTKEDERYWSLHTQTAQWVCKQILQSEVA